MTKGYCMKFRLFNCEGIHELDRIETRILDLLILGDSNPTRLSRALKIPKATLTGKINALERFGFVSRTRNGRNIAVSLTKKGRYSVRHINKSRRIFVVMEEDKS